MDFNWGDAEQVPASRPRSSGRLIGLFVLLGVVVLMVLAIRTLMPGVDTTPSPAVGNRYEGLQLEPLDSDGEPLTLDGLQGQVALINFWGPWCPPCRLEFPELIELRDDLAENKSFRLLSVTCMPDQNEQQLVTQTKTYLQSQGYDLPVHRDPTFASRMSLLELTQGTNFNYPTTVLLDQQGVIRHVWTGYRPGVGRDMRQRIDELLKK